MRYLLLDRITRWVTGSDAEAVKNASLSEDFFDDHFPLKPVMPGTLIVEGMAQLAGLPFSFRQYDNPRQETARSAILAAWLADARPG